LHRPVCRETNLLNPLPLNEVAQAIGVPHVHLAWSGNLSYQIVKPRVVVVRRLCIPADGNVDERLHMDPGNMLGWSANWAWSLPLLSYSL
jgi:hypothetical protein